MELPAHANSLGPLIRKEVSEAVTTRGRGDRGSRGTALAERVQGVQQLLAILSNHRRAVLKGRPGGDKGICDIGEVELRPRPQVGCQTLGLAA